MKKILYDNQITLLDKIKIGQKFTSEEAGKLLNLKRSSLGGVLSGLSRSGYIKAMYRITHQNIQWVRIE